MSAVLHSVVIPVLNGAALVAEAIASALAQLGPHDEVIVVDNGSTDGTPERVAAHADARVRLLHGAKRGPAAASNRGPATARNRGIAAARGRFLAFLDHDDLWPPGRQAGLCAAIESHPGADAAHGRLRISFEGPRDARYDAMDGLHLPDFGLHTYLFRRELLERVGPLDEALIYNEDIDYLLRLRAAGMRRIAWEGDAAIHRRHASNTTHDRVGYARGLLQVMHRQIGRARRGREG
jgi:glycosyltransferase involved in cell wall biosynthesis